MTDQEMNELARDVKQDATALTSDLRDLRTEAQQRFDADDLSTYAYGQASRHYELAIVDVENAFFRLHAALRAIQRAS